MTLADIIIKWGLERLGRYYSNYRAVVTNNVDPEKLGRVEVIVPRIHYRNKTAIWAYPKNQYIGKDMGLHILPKKEEMIWVEFEGGNPRFPIWSFSGANKKQTYPEEFANKENIYGFKTKEFIIQVDDDKKSVTLEKKDGKKFLIDDEGIFLTKGEADIEPMLLGDKTQKVIQADIKDLDSLCLHLITFCDAVTAAAPNAPTIAPLVPMVAALKAGATAVKGTAATNKTNSNNIKSKISNLN